MRKEIMAVMVISAIMLTMTGIAVATEEEDPITFMGTITDANGNAVSGAEVIIIKEGTGHQWIATTNITGYYSKFKVIPVGFNKEGQYTMKLNGAIVDQKYLFDNDFTQTGKLQWSYTWTVQIPEFSTIAIPVISVIGLLFVLQNKKKKA